MRTRRGPGSRILVSGAACLLPALGCVACATASGGTASGGAASQPGSLKVVTFTQPPGTSLAEPGTLVEASKLGLHVTVRDGYACFTTHGTPVVWPRGFSAVATGGEKPAVRTASGSLLRNDGAYRMDEFDFTSKGDACSVKGQNVTVILSIHGMARSDLPLAPSRATTPGSPKVPASG